MNEDPVVAFLDRAGGLLRSLAEPGWDRIADAVIDVVRATPRGGQPLRANEPAGSEDEGILMVSDLVLRGALARAMRLDQICVPGLIEVAVEGIELKRVRIEITARYGSELRAVADRVRREAQGVVDDLLGGLADVGDLIDVVVTDVYETDPASD